VQTTEPRIETRPELSYAGIRGDLTMDELAQGAVGDLIAEVAAWLDARGVAPTGAPLVRYHVVDMASTLDVEIGFPVGVALAGDDRVRPGLLPAGRYAVLVDRGAENGVAGNGVLIRWAAEHGVARDDDASERGHRFRARYETSSPVPTTTPIPRRGRPRWRSSSPSLRATRRSGSVRRPRPVRPRRREVAPVLRRVGRDVRAYRTTAGDGASLTVLRFAASRAAHRRGRLDLRRRRRTAPTGGSAMAQLEREIATLKKDLHRLQADFGKLASHTGSAVQTATESVQEVGSTAVSKLGEGASKVVETLKGAGQSAVGGGETVVSGVQDQIQEHPFVVTAAAIGLGLAIGMLIASRR
jgi:ElaB/YqjD/DUF883 family membrane-anchored ribosome-binding protein